MYNTNTPPIVRNLLIVNVLVFLTQNLLPPSMGRWFEMTFALHSPMVLGEFYQLFSYMFMHAGLSHLFFNMFALWMFGRVIEYDLGSKRFLTYYLVCGVGAGLMQLGVGAIEGGMSLTVGASGAVYGLLLAYGMLHPNNTIMLMFPPIALKAKWFVVIYGVIELFAGIASSGGGVAHYAHLGGMLWGFLLLRYWKKTNQIWY
ncbi:MAG: rhomboid family intramembrane serine protease [Rikenellaceae bacterium]|nr:rhomboid family intramembrane serine protease [Rikenellaceae bacterium]